MYFTRMHSLIIITTLLLPVVCSLPGANARKTQPGIPLQSLAIQEGEKTRHERASELLDRAPVLREKSNRLKDKEFIDRSKHLVDSPGLDNKKESIIALEALLAEAGDVTANVKSIPDKLDVEYRRYVDDKGPWLGTTTNGTVKLRPALYVFKCHRGGKEKEKIVSCSTDCVVEFVFEPGD